MTKKVGMDNPFTPGIGKMPPEIGRRKEIDRVLDDVVQNLAKKTINPEFVFLYGPRGNGKTVLMNWLGRQARECGILTLTLAPLNLRSDETLLNGILNRLRENETTAQRIWKTGMPSVRGEFKAGEFGIGGAVEPPTRLHPKEDPVGLLRTLKQPLLIKLDEAHKEVVDPIVLGTLMDAVQILGEDMPVALALAGTPGLEDQLRATGSSYWSRGHKLPVGRLEPDAATQALTLPLQKKPKPNFVTDSKAIARLIEEANRYPYFLQLYGRAAFDAIQTSGTMRFGQAECDAAVNAAEVGRTDYYRDRYQEFRKAGELKLARTVAQAFRVNDNRLTSVQLNWVLDTMDPERSVEREIFLRHRGYIWQQPNAVVWEPGIPSLMDFMVKQTEPEPPA